LWAILAIVIGVMVALKPSSRSVTISYREAAEAFLHAAPMYHEGKDGWLYPVWSAMVYIPFTLMPIAIGEVLWRFVSIALYAWSIWRLAHLVDGEASSREEAIVPSHFLLLTLLTLPAAIGSAKNGQMNLPMGAAMLLGCLEAHEHRWWRSAIWLTLALTMKPIAIVLVLLVGVLHPRLAWRLAIAALVMLALPFINPHWGYVAQQYREGLAKVVEAGEPGVGRYAELTSLLRKFGVEAPYAIMTGVRAIAAVATLVVCWLATRRLDRARAIVTIFALGTAYLMVFNPRTEGNSYIIVAPGIAAWAAWMLQRAFAPKASVAQPSRHRVMLIAWMLVVACVLLGVSHMLVPAWQGKDRVIRPFVTLVFFAGLGGAVLFRAKALASDPPALAGTPVAS
jgi:hypothetical protein